MGDGVAGAAGQGAISQRFCKCVARLHGNFPQEFAGKQVIEKPLEVLTRRSYGPLRESLYLHRSRYIVYGANDDKHIRKGAGRQEYVKSTRTIPQFPSAGAGIAREIERDYR